MADLTWPDLSRACLVVAHPDDEVLWFSAIVDRVASVILCFEDCEDYPAFGPGRRAVPDAYPLDNVSALRLPEPGSVDLVDWRTTHTDEYGVVLNGPRATEARRTAYRRSYRALHDALRSPLSVFDTVFTHNPWGEYGHPDHVQVARVVDALHDELGFRTLCSGYISARSMPIAAEALARIDAWFERPTQPDLVAPIRALYLEHDCWTWPVDHRSFASEAFLEATGGEAPPGSGVPLNFITP